ncbi:hypothetical protein PIB30_072675 [Stylosanthes scabra]|uniref:Uncharacterized protein n=1 Tax=Stylosanthes scabra TaxID=79078 RepID=A0ABU6URW3_9FABA|nr:hypothetical protein [Stylosanthes scabra]
MPPYTIISQTLLPSTVTHSQTIKTLLQTHLLFTLASTRFARSQPSILLVFLVELGYNHCRRFHHGDGSPTRRNGKNLQNLCSHKAIMKPRHLSEGLLPEDKHPGPGDCWTDNISEWQEGNLDYDSEPEKTLLRRRRETKRRARQAALEQQLNMVAEHHDDNLNLENNQNRVTLGQ